jgi:head-tail adaptor
LTSAIFRRLLNTTAAIYTPTHTYNEVGEDERTWTLSDTVPARLDKSSYAGSTAAYAEQGIIDLPTHKLFLEAAVEIAAGNRVTVDGQSYEVVEVMTPGGVAHHKEAFLKWLSAA